MVSVEESHGSNSGRFSLVTPRPCPYYTPPSTSASPSFRFQKHIGRSMRTIRSSYNHSFIDSSVIRDDDDVNNHKQLLTESGMDVQLQELAASKCVLSSSTSDDHDLFLQEISQAFTHFSSSTYGSSSDISGELHQLAQDSRPHQNHHGDHNNTVDEAGPCEGFLQRDNFSTEIIESISPEDLHPIVKICVDSLTSTSVAVKRSAAAKLRLLAKNRPDNRALIGRESGAISALIQLLCSTDPLTQEQAVTALLNLSLLDDNKPLIASTVGAIKSLIYVVKTGTEIAKQNGACALLSLALAKDENNKASIGACGAIPPLVSLLVNASSSNKSRGKKDALTTLYKLCSIKANKKRAVTAGLVKPLIDLLVLATTTKGEETATAMGMAEKAMVVLCSLAAIEEGREAIVEHGGIAALVELIVIKDLVTTTSQLSSLKGKELAVITLLGLCDGDHDKRRRRTLVAEGAIPPLVAISQTATTARAKHKAERLLGYLREQRKQDP